MKKQLCMERNYRHGREGQDYNLEGKTTGRDKVVCRIGRGHRGGLESPVIKKFYSRESPI
ncbi:MAG: hypothetical protein QIT35_gp90 [Methanophagales virus PBV299]|uniref:Uncharacterized protein n=1 Tax=Methanophagales virus PBV299 TaxID=2987730 RepID=A0ABY6GLX0_9CAUD|nr:MAG: hypothetical protein QIT35_gp90 [Methanophagales virus PBV299]UYL64886.1 MAG: hypothetical protein OFDIEDLO_00090 [Methanophagales virus PBV299]